MAQLMPMPQAASAEIGILIEDAWQRCGIGTGLVSTLMGLTRATGFSSVHTWCLSGETGLIRAARRAGLDPIEVDGDDETIHLTLQHPVEMRRSPQRRVVSRRIMPYTVWH